MRKEEIISLSYEFLVQETIEMGRRIKGNVEMRKEVFKIRETLRWKCVCMKMEMIK